ncbi:MAG: hypothetical protein LQ352_007433 [Teloschistes flavicans]|nr:MAG: hypothetical protein LQ352_007433 [Teloschistes flavicans]
MQLVPFMQQPAYALLLIIFPLVHAAPPNLQSKIQAYLQTQGVNASIPASAYSAQPNAARLDTVSLTCGILNAYRDLDLVTPQDGQLYTTEAEQHWSPTAWGHPNCIFEPTTVREVQFFVGLLAITASPYAIRSGGHSPFKDFASTDHGVLIAMHKMKGVEYDAPSETVRLAMGNTWGDVYQALIPHQRIVVGGRLAPVGMALVTGGMIHPLSCVLGQLPSCPYAEENRPDDCACFDTDLPSAGGLSHYSNAKGFASDNVVDFEMVLADGSLIHANATSHSDLWWAMKAGQNNFGITTHITTKAYPMGAVWGGLRVWNASQLDAVSDAFAEYQRVGQLDTKSSVIPDLVPTNGTLFLTLIYFDSVTSPPAAFKPFYDIPAVSDNSGLHPNFLDLISVGPPQVVPRFSYGFSTLYLDNSTTYRDVMRLCAQQGEKMKRVNGGTQVLIPQPISKTMVDTAKRTGGRPQGLRSRAQLWMNMSWGWNLAKDDAYVYALIKETYEKVDALTKQRGLYDPYIFLNDAFPQQKVLRSYGAESFNRMLAVSKKYDPRGMFQTQVPGGFKLN